MNQRVYLERLLQEFAFSTWQYPDNERALRHIEHRIKDKNSNLRTYLAQFNSHYWTIQEKLQRPYQRKNTELVIHELLQNDLKILAELKKTSEDVLRNVNAIRERFARQEEPKVTFTLSEVRESLREQYYSLKKKYEDACDSKNRLMVQQVSPMNALERAKNIFVHGAFDKLYAQQKSYEETLEKVTHDKFQYITWERNFNSQQWTSNGDRLREFYYLTKKKIYLEQTERNLADTKFKLDNALARLENLCQTEQAQEKIAFLAANLLHKNLKIAQEYETAKKLVSDLSEKLQVAEKRFKALNNNYARRKKNFVYRVITTNDNSTKTSPLTKNELTAIIADALMGEPYAVQLVARFGDDNLEIEKDWEMMSEFDKDEIINKKIIREL